MKAEMERIQEDLKQKDLIIKGHILTSRVEGRSTPEMDQFREKIKKGSSSWLGRPKSADLVELNSKMEVILQDTLLKNIQLQTDLETLGKEISRLNEQIKQKEK